MTGTCGGCRHWGRPEHDWRYEGVFKATCGAIPMRDTVVKAAAKAAGFDDEYEDEAEPAIIAALQATKAIAHDADTRYAALHTQADFGCILFEAK